MLRTLRPVMLVVMVLLPLSPFLAAGHRQEKIHILDDAVYNDVNPGLELGVWEAIAVL